MGVDIKMVLLVFTGSLLQKVLRCQKVIVLNVKGINRCLSVMQQ